MRKFDPTLVVVLAGVSAALHVGKLAPALPVLSGALGITLVQAGFLLSLVQLAGMTLGLVAGVAADAAGLKRTMFGGLLILSASSLLGGSARDAGSLMVLRCAEGLGFLLVSVTGPGLIRRLVEPARMSVRLGLWGAYMPFGTAMALLFGPVTIAGIGWPAWWWLLGLVSLGMAGWLWRAVPAGLTLRATPAAEQEGWLGRLRRTLSSRGPWLVALTFAVYSSQWLAVIGFLPTMYAQAGVGSALAGVATSLAAAANMVGNIVSGRMLRVGARAESLLYAGFIAMALGAFVAFGPWWSGVPRPLAAAMRYAAVLLFSGVGGLIPGTLFSLAVRVAPGERMVSTTVGCLQQCSSLGQFAGPPLVAWVAARAGGWQWSWVVTGGCSVAGLALTAAAGRLLRRPNIVPESGASAT